MLFASNIIDNEPVINKFRGVLRRKHIEDRVSRKTYWFVLSVDIRRQI